LLQQNEKVAEATKVAGEAAKAASAGSQMPAVCSVSDRTARMGNLGWDEVRFPKPVFHGDTLHFQTEVVELRDTKSRPTNGIVIFAHRAYNQRNELVAACKRTGLMLRKPA
jgi:acyl dehydratase